MTKEFYNDVNKNWDRFKQVDISKSYKYEIDKTLCQHCKSHYVRPTDKKYFGVCELCNKRTLFIVPQPWQRKLLESKANEIINCGAVGTGKTFSSCFKLYLHLLTVNGAVGNIYASTLQQLGDVFKKELINFFIKSDFITFNKEKWVLKNGSIINWKSSADAFDSKGSNLTFVVITEANVLKDDSLYEEAKKRLRGKAAFTYLRDDKDELIYEKIKVRKGVYKHKPVMVYNKTLLILESNNEMSYMIPLIEAANRVYYTPEAKVKTYAYTKPVKSGSRTAFLTSLKDDARQPEAYIRSVYESAKLKKNVDVVLNAAKSKHENFLYPHFEESIISNRLINFKNFKNGRSTNNKVVFITDLGGRHKNNAKTTLLVAVLDLSDNICYVIDEYYATGSPKEHSRHMLDMYKSWSTSYEFSGHGCDEAAGRVAAGYEVCPLEIYRRNGIDMLPVKKLAKKADMIGEADYLFSIGKLKILNTCGNLINELYESYYRYNPQIKKYFIRDKNDDLTDSLNYLVRWIGIRPKEWKDFNGGRLKTGECWIPDDSGNLVKSLF